MKQRKERLSLIERKQNGIVLKDLYLIYRSGLKEFFGLIRTAYKRTACNFCKTHIKGDFTPVGKFIRWYKAVNRQVRFGGLKVLTQGQQSAPRLKKIFKCVMDLSLIHI